MLSAFQRSDTSAGWYRHTDATTIATSHEVRSIPTYKRSPEATSACSLRRCVEHIHEFMRVSGLRQLTSDLHQVIVGNAAGARPPRHRARSYQPAHQPASQPLELPAPLPWADSEPPAFDFDPQMALYIERQADAEAMRAIQGQGVTITIAGPHQAGKSSLLGRMAGVAAATGKHVVVLDLQLFESHQLCEGEQFFKALCDGASCLLGIEPQADTHWGGLGNSYHCTSYFEQIVLPQLDAPLVLAIDKVESISNQVLLADFAAMLRAWCSKRAASPLWRRLDLVLVTSIEPDQLVRGLQSPFNSGETIVVDDFTPDQVAELNLRHGHPFSPAQQQVLLNLLGGHPYLVRWAFYLAAIRHYSATDLLNHAHRETGPFGEHLRYQLFKLHSQPGLADGLRQVLQHGHCADEKIVQQLCSAGLVRCEGGRTLARCRLYATYFRTRI